MSTVTYKNQPVIHATRGTVPLAGTEHLYTVKKVLWPESIEKFLPSLFIGKTLHVCSGLSMLGDARVDMDPAVSPDYVCDAQDMKHLFAENSWSTVLCDPPYNGKMQWNHNLLSELSRIARIRIIFQHWFIPATKNGLYKKAQEKFAMKETYVWQGRTYFGRAQIISVFDRR
jgi:hypothetical protein